MKKNVLSVTHINHYIKNLLSSDFLLSDVFVSGEVSNLKAHETGLYFTLKDEKSQIKCVMFRDDCDFLEFVPENGMALIVYGRVSVYEKTGAYQLYAETLELAGKGEELLKFDRLKEKLAKEGLFDKSRKRRITKVDNVGVITSPIGAAVSDIISIAARLNPLMRIYVFPVSVQGVSAPGEIAAAISFANRCGIAMDALIVCRGGGSSEDLSAFNDEAVARAVYGSAIPIVSAVGHETDFTLCDFTADVRAETPSAAAEIICDDSRERVRFINGAYKALAEMILARLTAEEQAVKAFARALREASIAPLKHAGDITNLYKRLERAMKHQMRTHDMDIAAKMDVLETLSPLSVMKRGYAFVTQGDAVIKSAQNISFENNVKITFADGAIAAKPIKE